jgi:hypothetical protein
MTLRINATLPLPPLFLPGGSFRSSFITGKGAFAVA